MFTGFGKAPRKAIASKAARKMAPFAKAPFEQDNNEEREEMEEHEEPEVKQPPKKKVRPQRFGSRFASFTLDSTNVEYSLTIRTIRRPRINLLCRHEYVASQGQLYQISEDVPLPKIEPGYSVDRLLTQKVKAHKFTVMAEARSPSDRTRFAPDVVPTELLVGDISGFVDVYEPVGARVEESGIILSDQARMELGSAEPHCRIVPKTHFVRLSNKVESKGQIFAEAFAETNLPAKTPLTADKKLGVEAIISAAVDAVKSFSAAELIKFAKTFEEKKSEQLLEILRSRFVLYHVMSSQKDKVGFLKKITKLNLQVTEEMQKLGLVFEQKVIQCILCQYSEMSPISDVLATNPSIEQKDIKTIYQDEMKTMKRNKNQMDNWYLTAIELAMMHKNPRYLYFLINDMGCRPNIFGQLGQIALNNKLYKKDIKVAITDAKLFHVRYCPYAFAAFMGSNGFLEAVDEANIQFEQEAKNEPVLVGRRNRRMRRMQARMKTQKAEQSNQINRFITIGACSNISDNLDIVKRIEKKIGMLNAEVAIVSALLSQNKKILNYVMTKYQTQDAISNVYRKYLLPIHFDIIQDSFIVSPKIIETLSPKLTDEQLLRLVRKVASQTVGTTTSLHLYNGDMMSTFLLNGHVRCATQYLSWGFCFAKSITNYNKIGIIADNVLFEQVINILMQHMAAFDADCVTSWALLMQCAVRTEDEAKITIIQKMFASTVPVQKQYEYSAALVQQFISMQQPQMSWFNRVCEISQLKLINRYSCNLLNQLNFFEYDSTNIMISTQDIFDVVKSLQLSQKWQFGFIRQAVVEMLQQFVSGQQQSETFVYMMECCFSWLQQHNPQPAQRRQPKQKFGSGKGGFGFQQFGFQAQPVWGQTTDFSGRHNRGQINMSENEIKQNKQLIAEVLDLILNKSEILMAKIEGPEQNVQNKIAKSFHLMSVDVQKKFLEVANKRLQTQPTTQASEGNNAQFNYCQDFEQSIQKKLACDNMSNQLILRDPSVKQALLSKAAASYGILHSQNVFHFLFTSTYEQFELAIQYGESQQKDSHEQYAASKFIIQMNMGEFQPLQMNNMLKKLRETNNLQLEAQALFNILENKLEELQMNDFWIQFKSVYGVICRDLFLETVNSNNILHVVFGLSQSVLAKTKIIEFCEELQILDQLITQQNKEMLIPAMVCLDNQPQCFTTQLIPSNLIFDSEKNNILHYIMNKIGQIFNDQQVDARITLLEEVSKLINIKEMAEQFNIHSVTPVHYAAQNLNYLQIFGDAKVDFAKVSVNKTLATCNDRFIMQFLAERGCNMFTCNIDKNIRDTIVWETQTPFAIVHQLCVQQNDYEFLKSMIKIVKNEEMVAQTLLAIGDPNSLEMLNKMKPHQSIRHAQLFVLRLNQQMFAKLADQQLQQFAVKFGLFKHLNHSKLFELYKNEQISKIFIQNIVSLHLRLPKQLLTSVLQQAITRSGPFGGQGVLEHVGVLLNEQNVNGLFEFITIYGTNSGGWDFYAKDSQFAELCQSALLFKPVASSVISAFMATQPKNKKEENDGYKCLMKKVLKNYVMALNIGQNELQKMVSECPLHWSGDSDAQEFAIKFGINLKFNNLIEIPKNVNVGASENDVQIMQSIVDSREVSTNLKQSLNSNILFETKNNLLFFKNIPCSVIGFRRAGAKIGVMVLQIQSNGNNFYVKTQFRNSRIFDGNLESVALGEDYRAMRRQRILFESQNASEALSEFRKFLAKKTIQSFEQIMNQELTLEGQQSGSGFHFMLRHPQYYKNVTHRMQNALRSCHQKLSTLNKSRAVLLNAVQYFDIDAIKSYCTYKKQFDDLQNMTDDQLLHLYQRSTGFRGYPSQFVRDVCIQKLQQLATASILTAKCINILATQEIDKDIVTKLLEARQIVIKQGSFLGQTGLIVEQIEHEELSTGPGWRLEVQMNEGNRHQQATTVYCCQVLQGHKQHYTQRKNWAENGITMESVEGSNEMRKQSFLFFVEE